MWNVGQNWNHRSSSRKRENFSKSRQFNYQHFPCDLTRKANTHTLCFCPLIRNYRRLKFWSGLKEVNGESRGHPISRVKYNLYFHSCEIQLFFIFSRLWNTAFLKYALYLINIFLYFITLYIMKSFITSTYAPNMFMLCLHKWHCYCAVAHLKLHSL